MPGKKLFVAMFVAALSVAPAIEAAAIHDAVQASDIAKVRAIVESEPAQVHSRDDQGRTPLHWAARSPNLEILTLLVDR
ncbi:MAG: ankyrin repeat domain-containing protein, partial [Thermoanaerobaculia bacterium]